MKRNLIALALVLFSGGLLFASGQSLSRTQSSSLRVTISKYGTLSDVLKAGGSTRFGELTLDGFEVSYKFEGEMKTVWAKGETDVKDLWPGDVKVDGNSASVTVKTVDGAWEITSLFALDEQGRMLTISRSIKNISGQPLSIEAVKQYVDPKLTGATCSTTMTLLDQKARQKVRANGCENTSCPLAERPPHDPPCFTVVCMQESALYRPLMTTEETPDCKKVVLKWQPRKRFAPQDQTSLSNNEVSTMRFAVGVIL